MTTRATMRECQCKGAKAYGLDLQRWTGSPKFWQGIGTAANLFEAREKIAGYALVLVRCRACGTDILREFPKAPAAN